MVCFQPLSQLLAVARFYEVVDNHEGLEYAPGLDAEEGAHGLDGVHHEIDGSGFVGGNGGGTAIVVDVECYLCGTTGGEELVEVECVGDGDGDVL